MANPNIQPGTSYLLQAGDNNTLIGFTSSSPITITIQHGLPITFTAYIYQFGAASITVAALGDVTLIGAPGTNAQNDLLLIKGYGMDQFVLTNVGASGTSPSVPSVAYGLSGSGTTQVGATLLPANVNVVTPASGNTAFILNGAPNLIQQEVVNVTSVPGTPALVFPPLGGSFVNASPPAGVLGGGPTTFVRLVPTVNWVTI